MSFLRHEEIYRSDVGVLCWGGAGRPYGCAPHLIVSMSFRLAIPWKVALQQSRPPLRQPGPVSERKVLLAMICQRMATSVTTTCLRHRVQCRSLLARSVLVVAHLVPDVARFVLFRARFVHSCFLRFLSVGRMPRPSRKARR